MLIESFNILAGRLAGLFALAWLGWTLVRRGSLEPAVVRAMAHLVVDLTLPALIFIGISSLSTATLPWVELLLGGFGVSCLGLLLASPFVFLKNIEKKGTFLFSVAVANSSFLPLPFASALWGAQGTQACLIYIVGNNLFLLSVGLALLRADQGDLKKPLMTVFFLHPQILAAVAGLLWRLGNYDVPAWAFWTLKSLGDSTIPLAMLAMGGLMAAENMKTFENKGFLLLAVALKLLGVPLLVLIGLKILEIKGITAAILLLQAAMPSLASAAAYASRFGGDPIWAGKASFLSSLGSLLTLPAFLALGAVWGLF
jgi:predicted permease